MPYFPRYQFASPCAPPMQFRPFWPVRLYDGRLAWLKRCWRQRMAPHAYLPGPGYEFWSVTDHPQNRRTT